MARDRQILDAAAALFFERGFDAVGVDEIGAKAGVSGPAVYRHFSGKGEILAALYDEAIDGVVQATSRSFEHPYEELKFRALAHATYVLREQKLASVWIREDRSVSAVHRRRLRRRENQYVRAWANCIVRCYPDLGEANALAAAHMALGTVNSVARWPEETLRSVGLPETITVFVLAGIGAAAEATAQPPVGTAV